MNSRVLTLGVAILLVGMSPAFTADPAGQAVSVNQNTAASGVGGNRTLVTSGMVFSGDRITTDAKGEAQLRFNDDTRMIVGPNSNIGIDKFVVTGPASGQKVAIDAAKGAFRFITGNAPKQVYEISTPVATISVRGTVFDFSSGPQGIAIMLYRDDKGTPSAVDWCEKVAPNSRQAPQCFEISDPCTLILIPNIRTYELVTNGYEKTRMAQQLFPFVDKRTLRSDFKVRFSECAHYETGSGGGITPDYQDSPPGAPPAEPTPPTPPSPPDRPDGPGGACTGGGCP